MFVKFSEITDDTFVPEMKVTHSFFTLYREDESRTLRGPLETSLSFLLHQYSSFHFTISVIHSLAVGLCRIAFLTKSIGYCPANEV